MRIHNISLRSTLVGVTASLGIIGATALPVVAHAATVMPISFNAWHTHGDFASGQFEGGARIGQDADRAALTLDHGTDSGAWISKTFYPTKPMTKIVASWQADTPGASWIETKLSVDVDGTWSDWFSMGKWAFDTTAINRTSTVPDQVTLFGAVYQDTYFANTGQNVTAYRLREEMHGNSQSQPSVRQLAVTASDPTVTVETPVSATTMSHTVDLNVPQYSQYVHTGEYTMLDGGGPSWCSPASVSMVLQYFGKQPTAAQIAALPPDSVFDANHRADGLVDYAAWHIFDYGYQNTGDWPFNMGYAASFGMNTSVRQYTSLRDIETWIKHGVPIVITTSWDNTSSDPSKHLDGASIAKTPGHLMVVRGFTKQGDVIANDPATPVASGSDAAVRHIYNRAQFEHLWQTTADGTVYVVQPQPQW